MQHIPTVDPSSEMPPERYFWRLVRWCWPYMRPFRALVVWSLAAMTLTLIAQAIIPLVISDILEPPTGGVRALTLLAVLIVMQILGGYAGQALAYTLANRTTTNLRIDVFSALLSTRYLQQPRLFRSSVVSRHTSDVDHISEAIEATITTGLPGVLQVTTSLILLSYIDYRSGLVMLAVTLAFLLARAHIGRTLLVRDRVRLDANSQVGELVDETISMAAPLAGLHLEAWSRSRFERLAHNLQVNGQRQNSSINQLGTAAHGAGLIGLFSIMLFASLVGGAEIALVAAALMYITYIVEGLARMPKWVRQLQLAVVSRRRIDQVLLGARDSEAVREALAVPTWRELAQSPPQAAGLVGLVTATGLDEDTVLTAMSGTDREDAWRVSLFGRVLRCAGVRPDVLHVPDEPALFNVSVRDHLRAVQPDFSDADIERTLRDTGLEHLADLPGGLDEPVGQVGSRLTSMERSRLLLAMAAAAHPRVLLVGPLTPLADIDSAATLIATLRGRGPETVVMAVRSPDVAAAMDHMMYVTDDQILVGSHAQLLAESSEYSRLWTRKLLTEDVDLSELGLDEQSQSALHARLVTERFSPGEVIYRQGDPPDRILFIISGHVEVRTSDGTVERRIAVLGPGNHCGDLSLAPGQTRAETAVAMDDCVIRSLSRGAFASGVMGVAFRPLEERRVVAELLRGGSATLPELTQRLPDIAPEAVASAVAELCRDGLLTEDAGRLRVVQRRRPKRGTEGLHARLLDSGL